ncbi:MAG: hypothetical protein ACK5TI_00075 [bacterium]|nr:hypothetical protein [Brevundimonas sp.]MCZ8193538.1 hypothetical protein [Brevundimonas sp.]
MRLGYLCVWKWTEPMRNRPDVVELILIVGVILATLVLSGKR